MSSFQFLRKQKLQPFVSQTPWYCFLVLDRKPTEHAQSNPKATQPTDIAVQVPENATSPVNNSGESASSSGNAQRTTEMEKKRLPNSGRGRGSLVLPKGRGTSSGSGWTGAGFDVDGGT